MVALLLIWCNYYCCTFFVVVQIVFYCFFFLEVLGSRFTSSLSPAAGGLHLAVPFTSASLVLLAVQTTLSHCPSKLYMLIALKKLYVFLVSHIFNTLYVRSTLNGLQMTLQRATAAPESKFSKFELTRIKVINKMKVSPAAANRKFYSCFS